MYNLCKILRSLQFTGICDTMMIYKNWQGELHEYKENNSRSARLCGLGRSYTCGVRVVQYTFDLKRCRNYRQRCRRQHLHNDLKVRKTGIFGLLVLQFINETIPYMTKKDIPPIKAICLFCNYCHSAHCRPHNHEYCRSCSFESSSLINCKNLSAIGVNTWYFFQMRYILFSSGG